MEVSVAMRKKTSPIWDYFTIAEDDKFANSATCELQVTRGGKTAKTFRTTNMSVHLKGKHPKLYTEFEKKVEELKEAKKACEKSESRASHRQLSLQQCEDQIRHWGINDIHAQQIHQRIGEKHWIATHSL